MKAAHILICLNPKVIECGLNILQYPLLKFHLSPYLCVCACVCALYFILWQHQLQKRYSVKKVEKSSFSDFKDMSLLPSALGWNNNQIICFELTTGCIM